MCEPKSRSPAIAVSDKLCDILTQYDTPDKHYCRLVSLSVN